MKKAIFAIVSICAIVCFVLIFSTDGVCFASEEKKTDEQIKNELQDAYDKTVDNLDLSGLQEYLDSLSQEGRDAISVSDVRSALKALARGESEQFFDVFSTFWQNRRVGIFSVLFPVLSRL